LATDLLVYTIFTLRAMIAELMQSKPI